MLSSAAIFFRFSCYSCSAIRGGREEMLNNYSFRASTRSFRRCSSACITNSSSSKVKSNQERVPNSSSLVAPRWHTKVLHSHGTHTYLSPPNTVASNPLRGSKVRQNKKLVTSNKGFATRQSRVETEWLFVFLGKEDRVLLNSSSFSLAFSCHLEEKVCVLHVFGDFIRMVRVLLFLFFLLILLSLLLSCWTRCVPLIERVRIRHGFAHSPRDSFKEEDVRRQTTGNGTVQFNALSSLYAAMILASFFFSL